MCDTPHRFFDTSGIKVTKFAMRIRWRWIWMYTLVTADPAFVFPSLLRNGQRSGVLSQGHFEAAIRACY